MSLRQRILSAFVLVVLLTVLLGMAVAYWSAQRELQTLAEEINTVEATNIAQVLSNEYTLTGGWDTLELALFRTGYVYDTAFYDKFFSDIVVLGDHDLKALAAEGKLETFIIQDGLTQEFAAFEEGLRVVVVDVDGRALYDTYGDLAIGEIDEDIPGYRTAVVDLTTREPVGYVLVEVDGDYLGFESAEFLQNTLFTSTIGGLLTGVIALLIGAWLARQITAPVAALTRSAQAIAEHGSTKMLPITTSDELGQMSAAFNQMNTSLQAQRDLRKRLINDVSHELNTPLSVIRLEAKGLRDGMQSPEEASTQIINEIDMLQNLVQDLNWLGETDAGEIQLNLESLTLKELLAAEVARWQPQAQAREIDLVLNAIPTMPNIMLDKLRMSQIMGNLLRNALQHTEANGAVTISAETRPIPMEEGSWAVITVADTGVGIDSAELPHIFERFYRSDQARSRKQGSRGLGLAITRQLVRLHGGYIWVESTVGAGSKFFVALR